MVVLTTLYPGMTPEDGIKMSIATCPYCGTMYDQDYNVEHEEICEEELREEENETNKR